MRAKMKTKQVDSNHRLAPVMPYILIVSGSVGLASSFILSYEEMQLDKNPAFVPACNLNPIISCGTVLHATASSVFGFPNAWLGLVCFGAIITVGASLAAGAAIKHWFWLILLAGVMFGVVFAYWMLWQSVYIVKALCPFCLSVDAVMTTIFWYVLLYVTREGYLVVPRRLIGIADFARRHHLAILLLWTLFIIALILHHFWYYYGQYA